MSKSLAISTLHLLAYEFGLQGPWPKGYGRVLWQYRHIRALHPARGTRIGEATQPGPSSSQPEADALPSDRTADSQATPQDTQIPGDAAELQHARFNLHMVNGKKEILSCRWLPRTASWKWGLGPTQARMAHQNRGTPAHALRNWVARYEMEVLQGWIG